TARSSLEEALPAFQDYMRARDFSEYTIRSFTSDLRILGEYLGMDRALGDIGTRDLNRFVRWLTDERGVPCTPKSLSRRITTLKVFFGWLAETGVLPEDPAAPVIHRPVLTGPPRVLSDEEVTRVLEVTEALRHRDPPDPRPHLLVTLLLSTGIKKGECMNIALDHIDLSDPARPMLWVRYASPRRKHKERRLPLPAEWPAVLAEYRARYDLQDRLFPCTARNLEYVLDEVARQAGLPEGLSFEMLRWTCAVRDYREGMPPEQLRQKLGLTRISWREVEPKLARLAEG
ncbi:MAG: tyrosine-type recombinase/integrase, partial [Anaerolineae bacterium]